MRKTWQIGTLLVSGLLFFHTAKAGAPETAAALRKDPRLPRLRQFFDRYNCPVKRLAPIFLDAADRHRIDWRLLPAIAFVESGGGKDFRRNNIFGWGNGDVAFRSVHDGIARVAERLANSDYYRGKDLDEILYTYNPLPNYSSTVKSVMKQLGPEIVLVK